MHQGTCSEFLQHNTTSYKQWYDTSIITILCTIKAPRTLRVYFYFFLIECILFIGVLNTCTFQQLFYSLLTEGTFWRTIKC